MASTVKIPSQEIEFVSGVATKTGLDPRVLIAWVQAEGAYAPNGTGGFNFLNLKAAPGGKSYSGVPVTVSSGGFEQFTSVNDAVTETVNRLQQPFAAGILNSKGQTAVQQIAAIGNSSWDASHYGGNGGQNLRNDYTQLWGNGALTSAAPGGGAISQIASDLGSVPVVGNIVKAGETTGGTIKTTAGFISEITSVSFIIRAGEVIGGAVLMLAGLFLLAKQIGLAPPSIPTPARAVADAAPQTSTEGTGPPRRVIVREPIGGSADVDRRARVQRARNRPQPREEIPF